LTSESEYAERRARLLGPMRGLSEDELKREVRESYSKLSSAFESFSDEQVLWKPGEEEWSAAQIGDHVALGTGAPGNVIGLLAKGRAVTDADWDPPPQFRGDSSDLTDVKRRVEELPSFSGEVFDEAVKTDRVDVKTDNSLLGDLNWREWFYFLHLHVESHVEQMENLRSTEGFPG